MQSDSNPTVHSGGQLVHQASPLLELYLNSRQHHVVPPAVKEMCQNTLVGRCAASCQAYMARPCSCRVWGGWSCLDPKLQEHSQQCSHRTFVVIWDVLRHQSSVPRPCQMFPTSSINKQNRKKNAVVSLAFALAAGHAALRSLVPLPLRCVSCIQPCWQLHRRPSSLRAFMGAQQLVVP